MNEKIGIKEKLKRICTVEKAVKYLFTAFLLVAFFSLMLGETSYAELSFGREFPFWGYLALILLSAVVMAGLDVLIERFKPVEWCLLVFSFLFAFELLRNAPSKNQYHLYAAVVAVMTVIIIVLSKSGVFDLIPKNFDGRLKWSFAGVAAATACVIVASIGVYRYLTFSAPNFDFGIWCNMFHNMKESGVPNTTCERDMLLSHFAVHFSPIYYLMLPFYFVAPHPVTLQILQALVLYSGVVPLCIMAKHKGLSSRATALLAVVYSFYPAIAAGTFYDLHENCFLVPLLMWTFCFFEKEKYIHTAVFALLVLLVKEDAFIYLLVFAAYVFFLKGKKKISVILAASALLYFFIVSSLMKEFGTGVMSNRYQNLIYDSDGGLFDVLKTVILNPGYFLTQLFVSKNGDNAKILYVLQLLLPLSFLPFATKKISRYILALPILINIMTMYQYQPNIKFQYSFGITAFLFYLTVLNLSELGTEPKKIMLPLATVATVLMFAMVVLPFQENYSVRYEENKIAYAGMEETLTNELPDDASVVCSTMLLPHIADRNEIYEIKYHKENGKYKTDTEYAVFDMRYREESQAAIDYFTSNGYEISYSDENLTFMKKK